MKVKHVDGEDYDALYAAVCEAVNTPGPCACAFSNFTHANIACHTAVAVVAKRKMAPGVDGIEGSPHGHDVVPVPKAIAYLKKRGYDQDGEVTKLFDGIRPSPDPYLYIGSTREVGANRVVFGEAVSDVLDQNKVSDTRWPSGN